MQRPFRYGSYPTNTHQPTLDPPFVCYVLCYPWGEPFYVGAGRRSRITDWLSGKGSTQHATAFHVISSLRAQQMEPDVFVALTSFAVADVFAEERRLIAHYRAADIPLVNVTAGGLETGLQPRPYAVERKRSRRVDKGCGG